MPKLAELVGQDTMSEIASATERRIEGKIIKISPEGWGFIISKEIKFTRIFFHWTSLKQETLNFQALKQGMIVEFTPVETEHRGYRAIKIVVMQQETTSGNDDKAE